MKVCIIGAGLSGLITASEALDVGFTPTVFELRGDVGGLFNREDTEHCSEGQCSSYDELYLTISNYLMAFGEEPPPDGEQRRFWSRVEYLTYLKQFAQKRHIYEHVRFQHRVLSVKRLEDGHYSVTTQDLALGTSTVELYDSIAVCTGTNSRPFVPVVVGMETFKGNVRHAGDFNGAKTDSAYVDQHVMVVGFGESGADTFRAVSEVSSSTVLSLRSFPFVVQRLLHDESKYTPGAAADAITSPGHHLLHRSMVLWVMMLLASCCHFFMHFLWGFVTKLGFATKTKTPAPHKKDREHTTSGWHSGYAPHHIGNNDNADAFGQQKSLGKQLDLNTPYSDEAIQLQMKWNKQSRFKTFATKNYSSAEALVKDTTYINTAGIERVQGSTIYFNNGEEVHGVDTILWNTGYRDDFSFLEPELCPDSGARGLFKNAFKAGAPHTLAFVGWARPSFGGVPVCSEMVARYWMKLLSGDLQLPTKDQALKVIEEDRVLYKELFPLSGLNTLVDLYMFMDSMAGLIGCRPPLWRYALTGKFDLVWKYFYGQHVASWYRLHGPGSNFEEHAAVIRRLPVCLTAWNTVKHAAANLVNSTGLVARGERFDLMEWFDM